MMRNFCQCKTWKTNFKLYAFQKDHYPGTSFHIKIQSIVSVVQIYFGCSPVSSELRQASLTLKQFYRNTNLHLLCQS